MLRGLDLPADSIATSQDWGVAKPDPGFFEQVLRTADAAPERTVYVGDHPANDIAPARAAGLRTCLIRRGPWGHLANDDTSVTPDWRVDSILELPSLLRP